LRDECLRSRMNFLLGDTVLSETQNAHDIQHKVAMKFF
jgi:hypothetical protein